MSGPSKAEQELDPFVRFFRRVRVGDGCWEWEGLRRHTGHGRVMMGGRRLSAGEWAWELWYGQPVPEGHQINHHCDNPPCVRPDHLYVGTQRENIADRDRRGRHAAASQTHCKNGHPFSAENTRIQTRRTGTPYRRCLACGAQAQARQREKRRGADYL